MLAGGLAGAGGGAGGGSRNTVGGAGEVTVVDENGHAVEGAQVTIASRNGRPAIVDGLRGELQVHSGQREPYQIAVGEGRIL